MLIFLKKSLLLLIILCVVYQYPLSYLGFDSFSLVKAAPAEGNSGDTGGGDSAGSDGGGSGNTSGDGNDTSVGGGNFTDGGSGGGSNQNNSGDEGNNSGPTEDAGYNCGSECAAPVLSGTTTCEGAQPVINLSWSGVPTPTAANGWLGSTSFLMRNPRIYTGVLVPNNILRTFGVAYFQHGTFSFKDTYREYWIPAHTIPAWTEITSTDENNNPTGFVDHPATDVPAQLALTDSVSPSTTYLYQIYSSNASGSLIYSSGVNPPGFTPSLNFSSRTQLSNIVNITTFPCDGSPIPSPSVNPLLNPQINLSINTDTNTYYPNDLPARVKQADNAVLNWSVSNADTCVTSSSQPFWSGSLASFTGSEVIDTTSIGVVLFNIECTNSSGSSSDSIQLNISQLEPPYIQTTGGDVHTNETINFAQ